MAEREQAGDASAKVQEVAANVQQAAIHPRKRITGAKTEAIARRYFDAISAHDVEAAVAMWAPGGREHVRGQIDVRAPEGVRDFIGTLVEAVPDLKMEVVATTSEKERCAVQWRMTGTFAGAHYAGIAPTGAALDLEGCDVLTIRDGLIHANDAFTDSMTFARQIGMMPAQGSAAEQRMTGAFNAKTRLTSALRSGEAGLIAEGVWVVQGQPGRCNVYLIEDDGGVTLFDAGARTMLRAVTAAGARLGGIRRVILGHGHTDHRGVAAALGVPVLCHSDEVEDAEGSGGFRYWPQGLKGLPPGMRQLHLLLHRYAWDGGPVKISETLSEGQQIAGFSVVHLPGHAPGQIGLWREGDRLALTSDCFYTLDMWGRSSPPRIPMPLYNFDTEQARASMLKLAELEPAAAWPGHAKPLTGDVHGALERAAAEA
jgi:glyoxylase-like metal-dependent hydrolase (beta-lactamase superfamily II)/ketosteroid isomerase-like protein